MLVTLQILAPGAKAINFNNQIMKLYLDELMPGITEDADDNNYGSAAMQDVLCLQALSKRIHYGKFVAEAKYRASPEQYQALIKKHDQHGIMKLLTNESVEQKVHHEFNTTSAVATVLVFETLLISCTVLSYKPLSASLHGTCQYASYGFWHIHKSRGLQHSSDD